MIHGGFVMVTLTNQCDAKHANKSFVIVNLK